MMCSVIFKNSVFQKNEVKASIKKHKKNQLQ